MALLSVLNQPVLLCAWSQAAELQQLRQNSENFLIVQTFIQKEQGEDCASFMRVMGILPLERALWYIPT